MSTKSSPLTTTGVPDYRSPQGAYSTGFKPMTHQQFLSSPANRARYWARSFHGWPKFSATRPNASHAALAELEQRVSGASGWRHNGLQIAGAKPVELDRARALREALGAECAALLAWSAVFPCQVV